jgi:hypothetical protein
MTRARTRRASGHRANTKGAAKNEERKGGQEKEVHPRTSLAVEISALSSRLCHERTTLIGGGMSFQVRMLWDNYDAHPAFADLPQAIAYAKALLAQLPEDAHPETEVIVLDTNNEVVFQHTLVAWRLAVAIVGDKAYRT